MTRALRHTTGTAARTRPAHRGEPDRTTREGRPPVPARAASAGRPSKVASCWARRRQCWTHGRALALERLELVERLTACTADVYRLARGRTEFALQFRVVRATARTHCRHAPPRDRHESAVLRRSRRRDPIATQLLARLGANPIRRPRRGVDGLEGDIV